MKRAFSKKNLWDKAPRLAKAAIGAGVSKIPLPWFLGSQFRAWYRLVADADRWDIERIRQYQLQQLRRIVGLAWEKSEFYRESFKGVGFEPGDLKRSEDIQGLPTIDKNTVREHWERMLTRPITDRDVDLVTTGGTSGEPLRFYIGSSRHAPEFAHLTMCWRQIGYLPGDSMAVFRGRVITRPTQGMYYEYDPLFRHHYYSTFHMSPPDLRRYVEHLNRIKPKFLHAYPSSLYALAQFCLAEGVSLPSGIQGALLESEPVLPHQRALIKDKMHLPILSAYGLSEKVILAANCQHSGNYHVVPTYGYCEVISSEGDALSVAATGELTGTGFMNDVMPFIRYRTGDMATIAGTKCEDCRREHLLLTDIQPRRGQEFLVSRDGRTLISMTALNLHDDTFDGILRFQFVQDEPGKAVLQLVSARDPQPDAARFHRHFAPKLGHAIELEVRFVSEIPLTGRGKQPMILQRWKGFASLMGVGGQTTTKDEPAISR